MPALKHARLYEDVNPLADSILIIDLDRGDKVTRGGIIITDDNGKTRGIHPRWAKVYKVGNNISYVKPGDYVLIEHGHWTYGIDMELEEGVEPLYLQRANPKGIMLISENKPSYQDVQKGKD